MGSPTLEELAGRSGLSLSTKTDVATYAIDCPDCQHQGAEVDLAYPHTDTIRAHIPVIVMFRCPNHHSIGHSSPADQELFDRLPNSTFATGHRPAWWLQPGNR